MTNLTISDALNLLSHLEDNYNSRRKEGDNTWDEFVAKSVESNNVHNGTTEDLIFIAEDAVEKM